MCATRPPFYLNARHTLVPDPFAYTCGIQPHHEVCTITPDVSLGRRIGAADP